MISSQNNYLYFGLLEFLMMLYYYLYYELQITAIFFMKVILLPVSFHLSLVFSFCCLYVSPVDIISHASVCLLCFVIFLWYWLKQSRMLALKSVVLCLLLFYLILRSIFIAMFGWICQRNNLLLLPHIHYRENSSISPMVLHKNNYSNL